MKIVVIGAGGFIGGWICEELASRTDIELVACVRRWSSAVRLARRGLRVHQLDLESLSGKTNVVEGADVVVNVSVPPPSLEPELALRLYSACSTASVPKFIQFSSMAVYGASEGNLDEESPLAPSDDYGRGKAKMEKLLLGAAEQLRPQLFILRPTIVYGPFSETWTVRYARRIADGRWRSLGSAGDGICNLVHGQDVARATVQAALAPPGTVAQVLNINGPEAVTWNEYIERFGAALGVTGRTAKNGFVFTLAATAVHGVRRVGSWVKRKGMRRHLQNIPTLVGHAQSAVNLYPTPGELLLFRRKLQCSARRAASSIDFRPSISLDDGLRQSAQWCRVHGIV